MIRSLRIIGAISLFGIFAALALTLDAHAEGTPAKPDTSQIPVRFGFTKSMFADMNAADTRAAVKSYAILLGSKNNLLVEDYPLIMENADLVKDAFSQGKLDIISLTTLEFLSLPPGLTHPKMLSASMGGTFSEKYVLLVHKDSGFTSVADLRKKKLLIYSSLRGCLSPLWLDVLLANNNLETPSRFFASVTQVKKPSRTILPVFFRQIDACIVTQNAFKITCEMNPQVIKDLTVLAISPDLIPSVTCIRAGISPNAIDRVFNAVIDAQYTVSGRQVLTMFQCDRISELEDRQLNNVRELLATRTRLRESDETLSENEPLNKSNPANP